MVDFSKLLGYGVGGLGLSLSILAFRLLIAEQKVHRPRAIMLTAIYVFMGFSVILTLTGLSYEYLRLGIKKTDDRAETISESVPKNTTQKCENFAGRWDNGQQIITIKQDDCVGNGNMEWKLGGVSTFLSYASSKEIAFGYIDKKASCEEIVGLQMKILKDGTLLLIVKDNDCRGKVNVTPTEFIYKKVI